MFQGLSPDEYPDRRVLVAVLLGATSRLNDQGAVNLTEKEAAFLRQSGYTAALGAGWWAIPRVPLELLRSHQSLHRLATFWYGPRALDPPAPAPPGRYASRVDDPATRLRCRLDAALRNPDQRRLLTALARRPDGLVERRPFQQGMHRVKGPRFNMALDALATAGVVVRDGGWLVLEPDVRRRLVEAGIGVSRRVRARTKRRRSATTRRAAQTDRAGPRRYQRLPIPSRTRDPRAWGLAMRGRLGGLSAQLSHRARGVHPTAKATRARLAKRRLQRQQPRSAR